MSKFEKLIEYVVNEDMTKARELFHDLCVEKSRGIYENLLDEEELDEAEDAIDESSDEDLDDTDELDEGFDDEFGDELPIEDFQTDIEADEAGVESLGEMGGEDDMEDRVVDLEDAMDELEAKFSEIVDGGEYGDDEEGEEDLGMEFSDDEGEDDFGDEDEDEDEAEEDEFEESAEYVREYTEKVTAPTGSQEVGKGGTSVQDAGKSPVAKSGKGSIKLNTGDEKGASAVSSGSFGDGMSPDKVGKKLGKGPKTAAPKPTTKEKGADSKSPVAKSRK